VEEKVKERTNILAIWEKCKDQILIKRTDLHTQKENISLAIVFAKVIF
jgi:hypothetical protein